MKNKIRRIIAVVFMAIFAGVVVVANPESYETIFRKTENTGEEYGVLEESIEESSEESSGESSGESVTEQNSATEIEGYKTELATEVLEKLEVKGRAPKTGYAREEFYSGWPTVDGCNLRQRILKREFGETAVLDGCTVIAGEYDEPYTGEHLIFTEKSEISKGVQIDHIVALSDAWQKGAQYMEKSVRYSIATDPLNLLAVDASTNMKKSDGDAATWLPPNKKFRCQYVARQISVKYKYGLWVTEAEKTAIENVLSSCPNEKAYVE